jgi:hypothetical protein
MYYTRNLVQHFSMYVTTASQENLRETKSYPCVPESSTLKRKMSFSSTLFRRTKSSIKMLRDMNREFRALCDVWCLYFREFSQEWLSCIPLLKTNLVAVPTASKLPSLCTRSRFHMCIRDIKCIIWYFKKLVSKKKGRIHEVLLLKSKTVDDVKKQHDLLFFKVFWCLFKFKF